MEGPGVKAENERAFSRKWIVGIIVGLFVMAAVGGVIAAQMTSQPKLQFTTIAKPKKNELNTLKGQVVPSEVQVVYADSKKGNVQEVLVEEGQEVAAGDELFSYENGELERLLSQNAAAQELAQLRVSQADSSISDIRSEMATLESNVLVESESTMSVFMLKRELDDQENSKELAQLELEKAKAEQQALESQKNELAVVSAIDGIVTHVEDAANADNQTPLMTILSKEPYQIEGVLTERQRSELEEGFPVKVTSKSAPEQLWSGSFATIDNYPQLDQLLSIVGEEEKKKKQQSTFSFRIALNSTDKLYLGYPTDIRVEIPSEMEITIPKQSVREKEKKTFVYVVSQGKLKNREVVLEEVDEKTYRVLEGLKHGETYVVNPKASPEVKAGMEVKVK
ncbi:efflux RND transporter periplasmic adaptor subunit [Metabacillus iocasae]|uniref:HlyD family secretion protein n=1 Tax=Priestia iocasae TaxID=2291674 RepID=A0ABS2QXK1_9BACI|nr:efflux RND transporter periplasmic adaptor subunit [Metabacillus iocasae]MBM7703988.1 HlyD family secretion protein [Metabacillus iocasae]